MTRKIGLFLKHGVGRSKGFLQSHWPPYTPSPDPEQSLNLEVSLVSGNGKTGSSFKVYVTCIIGHQANAVCHRGAAKSPIFRPRSRWRKTHLKCHTSQIQ